MTKSAKNTAHTTRSAISRMVRVSAVSGAKEYSASATSAYTHRPSMKISYWYSRLGGAAVGTVTSVRAIGAIRVLSGECTRSGEASAAAPARLRGKSDHQ